MSPSSPWAAAPAPEVSASVASRLAPACGKTPPVCSSAAVLSAPSAAGREATAERATEKSAWSDPAAPGATVAPGAAGGGAVTFGAGRRDGGGAGTSAADAAVTLGSNEADLLDSPGIGELWNVGSGVMVTDSWNIRPHL